MEPSAYSIVMMNVKGFKMINERFGTEAGNTTLRYIHHVLQCHIRPSENEFVSRNESDSFFLCLRDAEPESIRTRLKDMAEEINSSSQEGVPRYPIPTGGLRDPRSRRGDYHFTGPCAPG